MRARRLKNLQPWTRGIALVTTHPAGASTALDGALLAAQLTDNGRARGGAFPAPMIPEGMAEWVDS